VNAALCPRLAKRTQQNCHWFLTKGWAWWQSWRSVSGRSIFGWGTCRKRWWIYWLGCITRCLFGGIWIDLFEFCGICDLGWGPGWCCGRRQSSSRLYLGCSAVADWCLFAWACFCSFGRWIPSKFSWCLFRGHWRIAKRRLFGPISNEWDLCSPPRIPMRKEAFPAQFIPH